MKQAETEVLTARVDKALAERVKAKAESERRTTSNFLAILIEEAMQKKNDRPRRKR